VGVGGGEDLFQGAELPAVSVALVDQDGGLGDVEALDGRVEEVPAHVGDHLGDDLVAVGLGGAQAGGVFGGGEAGPGQLVGQGGELGHPAGMLQGGGGGR